MCKRSCVDGIYVHARVHSSATAAELLIHLEDTIRIENEDQRVPNIDSAQYNTPRRSRRVWFTMAIRISSAVWANSLWIEESSTLVVNAHGALILLCREVAVGQVLKISDLKTGAERKCRVVMVGARYAGAAEVGIELLEPFADFWRVVNPPQDWAQFRAAANHELSATGTKKNS